MKIKKWLKFFPLALLGFVIICIIVYFLINSNNKKISDINDKIKHELEYLDRTTLYLINDLNNLNDINSVAIDKMSIDNSSENTQGKDESYSSSNESQNSDLTENSNVTASAGNESFDIKDNSIMVIDKENINWNGLSSEAENLYNSWVTITLDLNSVNVSNENILAFSENLDNLLVSINNKDKTNSLICLANLYSLIPKYMSETTQEQNRIILENVKSYIVSAYSIVNTGNWDSINTFLSKAETEYDTLMRLPFDGDSVKQSKINKCYVLLKELIKTANLKDVNLFYLKYINLMNEIEKITF